MAEILVPRRKVEWFDLDRNFTHQAFRFFEDLTETTNTTTTVIEEIETLVVINESIMANSAQMFNLKSQIESANDRIEDNEIDLATRPNLADLVNINNKSGDANERIEAIEIDLATRPRMSDIAQANKRIDELIDELITEIRAIAPDTVAQSKVLSIQMLTLEQLKLLNSRTEEAFETDLNEEDL